jgi:hypothetical protein
MLDPKFFELANISPDISEIVKQIQDKELELEEACKEMNKLSPEECYKEDELIEQEVQQVNKTLEEELSKLDMYDDDDQYEIIQAQDDARDSRNLIYSEYASTAYIPIQEELIVLGKNLSECLEDNESLANLKEELDEGLDSPSESWWQI